jgi:cardiolipin synthase A/B
MKSSLWVRALAVVGAVAILTVIVALFTSFGRRPSVYRVTEAPPVDDPDFLVSLAGAMGSPVRSGGTAKLLNNGVEFFPAMLEAIRRARQTINFTAYIWEPGQVSDQFVAALTERARAGVKVRLLLDGMGGLRAPREGLEALRAAGGRIEPFRPPRFGKLTRFHKRTHRRAIVIDGTVGFTGGAAVADKWLGQAESPDHWRDTMVQVTGPPAATLQTAFVSLWAPVAGELLTGPGFFPPQADTPGLKHVGVASSPSEDDHPLRLFFLQSFLAARRRLYITSPYFVPDGAVRAAVVARARAGVDVRVLLPNQLTDAKPIRRASHRYYEELLAGGVRIYEYQPTMMHTKGVVVDGKWSVVGSANMDIRSHELNSENVLGLLDEGFAAAMEATFKRDLARAREIKLAQWQQRGQWPRLLERACALFAEQY